MKNDEAKRIIQDCLESEYDATKFNILIANILTVVYTKIDRKIDEGSVKEAFRDSISSYTFLGSYDDHEHKKIAILEVRLKHIGSLQNARTMQRNFVADFLQSKTFGRRDAALVAFISPDGSDWRFSLVKMEYSIGIQEGKIKTTEDLTPARRWSFLVGKHEKCHTAQSRLLLLVMEESHGTTLAEIENAFDVERVTDEFFEQYKECFFRFKDEIDRVVASNSIVREHFESIGLDTANFAKKTLGQIAFLYFLQKKGWFGVPKSSDEWTGGNKEFLRKAFERHSKGEFGTKNFFNDILEPLFYTALNTDRINENYIYNFGNDFSYKIPFLNGGLFEPMKGYAWEKTDLTISDEIFSNTHTTKNGDIGWGIFDVFDRYNFTVSEDEPLEKEVAVDPEMLGKIFENLLEVRDRKSKGAFYTPRPIVHYMCQESLIEYLASTHLSISREDIEFFIRESERTLENDRTWKRKVDEKIAQSKQPYKGEYEHKTRVSIISNAQKLDDALALVRIADPAVGSGAFPLGMINEIVRARQILAVHTGSHLTAYKLKLHAIQESIYGVDLDPGAVEICQLRLWLSLIVDENTPHPLPNLNYRIVQGNSLIEEYEGIKLYDSKLLSAGRQKAEQMSMDSLVDSESNRLYELLQYKLKRFVETSGRTQKQHLKQEIDDLKYGLIEATLREQNKEDQITEIRRLREANITPFFLWKLEFSEVFQEKGGFDIVIGNPPYVQLQKFARTQVQRDLENANYQTFAKTGDLYCLFYERGLSMTRRETGVLCYITSNKWMRAGYGEKLRQYFVDHNPLKLLDLGGNVFSSATVDSNILLIQNTHNTGKTESMTIRDHRGDLSVSMRGATAMHFASSSGWFIGSTAEIALKKKIETIGKPLREWDIRINYGIKTGLNEAFIIDRLIRDRLITEDPRSEEIIKPILRGRDIGRYGYEFAELYIIFIPWHFPLHKDESISGNSEKAEKAFQKEYPVIYNHLLQFKLALEKRNKEETGIRYEWYALQRCAASYYDEFEKEKVVYPNMASSLRASYISEPFYTNQKCFIITGIHCKYITAYLNSKIGFWNFKKIGATLGSSGYEMSKIFIETLNLPPITPTNQHIVDQIEQYVQEILDMKKGDSKFDTSDLESQIDELVYRLYDTTPEEIAIIEGDSF